MGGWWVHELWQVDRAWLISWVFWVFLSITLHELAHGWAAIRQGDRTPIEMNRMTMNPFVHMGPPALIMFAICGITWGLMPVNPHRFRDGSRGEMFVSAAGPVSNLIIAGVCGICLMIWLALFDPESNLMSVGCVFFSTGCELNLFLCLFNLIPVPPLDGGTILSSLSWKAREFFMQPQAALIGLAVLIVVIMSPVGDAMWGMTRLGTSALADAPRAVTNAPHLRAVLAARRNGVPVSQVESLIEQGLY